MAFLMHYSFWKLYNTILVYKNRMHSIKKTLDGIMNLKQKALPKQLTLFYLIIAIIINFILSSRHR
jgi:hypothetical protein